MLFLDDKDICYDGEVSLNSYPNVSILSSFFFMLASIAIVTVVALIACWGYVILFAEQCHVVY